MGGKKQLASRLGISPQIVEDLKKLANMGRYDERHAPKHGEPITKLTPMEVLQCRDGVKRLIEAFEANYSK